MSGGGNKKKPTKTQGWEEAGSEFYQESYPTDAEIEVFPKDPKHLATLLPSKQTRAVASTMRIRTNDNRTMRRQTSSRSRRESTVCRRASTAADVQVSMLPDLSENLSNEQTTWEEIMEIKGMPVSMLQKREMKAKILNEPNLRLQGYEQFKWKRRKMWRQVQATVTESYAKMELWKNDLKRIEGSYGTGVVAYFGFLKWLLFLNVFIFSMIFLFIVLPTELLMVKNDDCPVGNSSISDVIMDLIQGNGFVERSLLFYGFYPNETFIYNTPNTPMYYNLPLAYIGVTFIYFLVSFIVIVKSAIRGFKERLIEGEGQLYRYCNLIFGGWDFCINNQESATIKHKAIYNEMKCYLETDRMEEMKQNRTRNEKIKLFLTRFLVNSVVLGILIACGCAIYFVFNLANRNSLENDLDNSRNFEQLLIDYAPAFTIICLNVFIPFIFRYLITFENYSPVIVVRLTLIRTIFLRLTSLFVFLVNINQKIINNNPVNSSSKQVTCWETYVGQQFYKLALTDFAVHISITFLVNFPRSLLAKHINNKCVQFIGEQSFDLPRHVLDAAYLQTLCWLGCFYAPLLSVVFIVIFFFMFHIKKFACLINSKPSTTIYRVNRSHSMFMVVLLVFFIFAASVTIYSIVELVPAKICGPFRGADTVWSRVVHVFLATPFWVQNFIYFFTTSGFGIPCFIILILYLYYYVVINSANRHMVTVLKNQLVLEGHDKQFLLERLSKFIKYQQDNQKRMRHVEVLHDGDTQISSN